MATITSAQSGNFSATSTWVGGVVPGSVDIAIAATGHVITIDTNITVIELQQSGTGYFTMGNGRSVTGAIRGNARTNGTLEITSTTTAVINGDVSTNVTAQTAVRIVGACTTTVNGNVVPQASGANLNLLGMIVISADGVTLNVNGNVIGQARQTHGIYSAAASSTISVVGNVTGGSDVAGNAAVGIYSTGTSANITVTGTVSGGVGSGAYGMYVTSPGSTITVTGGVVGGSGSNAHGVVAVGTSNTVSVTGNSIGGTGLSAHGIAVTGTSATVNLVGSASGTLTLSHGISSSATSNGVIFTGNMTDSLQGAVAVTCRVFRMSATNDGNTTYTNTVGYPNGTPVQRISPNLVTGMPAAANVRFGTTYGTGGALTGTLRVPPANAVASGVPVDSTTGTAALRPADIAGIVGAQIAAALTSPT